MAKVDTSALTQHFVGRVGDIVYRKVRGRIEAALRPISVRRAPPSAKQLAQQAEFGKACAYANKIIANPESLPLFESLALPLNITARNLAISDFFRRPDVEDVDVREYQGRTGDKITVTAAGTAILRKMTVTIRLSDGTAVEQGEAGRLFNAWVYNATSAAPAGLSLVIEAKAENWARCEAVKTVNVAV